MTEELETLLRESLPFVVVRSTSGESMSTSEYRERLLLVRSKYDPEMRDLISGFAPEIDNHGLKNALLGFLRTELMDYLHEDRIRSARDIFRSYYTGGAPIDFVLRNLLRRAIADGEAATAQAFAECVTVSSCSFCQFYALAGFQVDGETKVFDGMWFIPLSNTPDQLPAYLPRGDMHSIFIRRPGEIVSGRPWARTLLRCDYDVSPIFSKPSNASSEEPDPNAVFDISMRDENVRKVDWPSFFQALSMVCRRPIRPVLIWNTFPDPYEIFYLDVLIGPTSATWNLSDDYEFDAPNLVESHIAELRHLYSGISGLDPKERSRLQVPITRWITSVGQRDEVDRMIDLGIALEALYLGNRDNQELRFKLALRASWHLGKNKTNRQELFRRFRQIYDYRSQAVHRGVFLEKRTSAEREEFIKGAQELCLRSIKTAIAQRMPKNDKEWEAWVLGDCGIN